MDTLAPAALRVRATASPMPPYPPVTNATFPSSSNMENRHCTQRSGGRASPFDGKHANREGMIRRGNLVQVAHVLQVVILAFSHDPVGFPEFLALEHLG